MRDAWVIDGITGSWARLETPDGDIVQLPVGWLPAAAREGHVLRVTASSEKEVATIGMLIDDIAEAERTKEMEDLRAGIDRAPSGDLNL